VAKLITPKYALRRVIVKALKELAPSFKDVAKQIGASYGAVRMYLAGQRTPSPKICRAIVAALRKQSGRLAKLADELEAASKRR
jgi:predicted transcriptional regulator